jgi:hypothetical protein
MSASASKKLGKAINKRTYFLLAGLIGLIAADFAYPPLDRNWILLLGLALFFLPVVAQIASRVRKRGTLDADPLKKIYSRCAVLLAGLAGLTFLNGGSIARRKNPDYSPSSALLPWPQFELPCHRSIVAIGTKRREPVCQLADV